MKRPVLTFLCASAVLGVNVRAAELTRAQMEFFENKIRPIFANQCAKCHSRQAEKIKGGLLLDTRESLVKGGDSGPAVVPGDPEKSLLIKAVRYADPDLQMPPKGDKLSDSQVADLVAWVKMGAPDPRVATADQKAWADQNDKTKHWAWQPVKRPSVPETQDPKWIRTPVDNFILTRLEQKGMKSNPLADKRTLLRRASFDLIGLPPTTEEVMAFLNDESPEAFARVVERLLKSPHYGERWGRYWLDIARYSDTKGQVRGQREDANYPFAWTYRDYVIRSFNEDKPYNYFVVEQLAADKLPTTSLNKSNLAALGFLTVGERFLGMQQDIINDRIDVVTKGFLGLTVTCARCHDHKFDPIPQQDYYSLHGIFASSREPAMEPIISKVSDTPEYREYFQQCTALQREKEALEEKAREARKKKDRDATRQLQRQLKENVTKLARLDMTHPGTPVRSMVLEDIPRPKDSPVFIRGEAESRGPVVPRRFLEVLSGPKRAAFTNGSGRLELALAIVNKNDPLVARVMINRIWLHHFGEGFVSTADDFGMMSEPPSHPELLDYLASRFVAEGWSLKNMHRLIMLSSAYQQSSANNPRYAQMDPNNRLLWRQNIRRLEFEILRDSLLAIGGTLDETMYGRSVDLTREPYSTRRTIYGVIDRANVAEVLLNFDFASPDMPNGKRHLTTVPQQALFLMNSPLVVEQARNLVARSDFRALPDDRARVQYLYERVYQRRPSLEEIRLGQEFVSVKPTLEKVAPIASLAPFRPGGQRQPGRPPVRRVSNSKPREPLTDWEEYAHALLQANEASFVN